MANPPLKPGIPSHGQNGKPDAGQPSAHEIAEAAVRERQEQAKQASRDDRLRGSLEDARGGNTRYMTNEEWDRARMPTDPERLAELRAKLHRAVMPNLPQTPNIHRFWASTSHPTQTPQRFMSLGFRLCKLEDLKSAGWDADEFSILDASTRYPSAVGWRELVAMEGPRDLYEDIMRLLHHDEPLVQARSITETLDAAGEEARAKGGRTTLAPGFEEMRKFQRPPQQFE